MAENKKHILVVDDEEHLAVGIKFNLEAEGFPRDDGCRWTSGFGSD